MHPITRNHVRPRRSALRAGRLASGLLAVVLAAGAAGLANAQGVQPFATKPRSSVAPDRCLALSHNIGPRALIQKASWRLAQAADQGTGGGTAPTVGGLKPTEARLSFIGHSTFLIESAKGITIATDYNDIYRARIVPLVLLLTTTAAVLAVPFDGVPLDDFTQFQQRRE